MKENISAKTVCGFYASANIYGLDSVMKKSDLQPFLRWKLVLLVTKSVFSAMNSHHALYVFVHLFVQVSWVASKQPDDPPKCGTDEGTWVCVLCSQVFPCFTRSSSLVLFTWCHWNFYDNKDILLHLFMERPMLLMPFYFLQDGGDAAGHPVLGPVCHAGGDGCIYSFEEGRLKTWLPAESSLPKPVSKKNSLLFSLPAVDVSAAQPIVGRSH